MPFRWIYWLAKIVYKCKKNNYAESAKQDKQKYFFLLRELILNKQESDKEISYEDKIDGLKKDIINEVRKVYLHDKFEDLQKNIDDIKNVHLEGKFEDLKKDILNEIQKFHKPKVWENLNLQALICCFIIIKKADRYGSLFFNL